MSSPEQAPSASPHQPDVVVSPRTDFLSGFGWMGLGIAILIGSVMMDRLENQDINPYTIPGLLPGLLGIVKREVTSAISRSHGLHVADLVLVAPGSLPITTSGKVRRAACVEQYRNRQFTRIDH